MGAPKHDPAVKEAAIADYYSGTDDATVVAARHGIPIGTFREWRRQHQKEGLGYHGGWETVGLVKRPLFPERRSA